MKNVEDFVEKVSATRGQIPTHKNRVKMKFITTKCRGCWPYSCQSVRIVARHSTTILGKYNRFWNHRLSLILASRLQIHQIWWFNVDKGPIHNPKSRGLVSIENYICIFSLVEGHIHNFFVKLFVKHIIILDKKKIHCATCGGAVQKNTYRTSDVKQL